MFRRRTCTASWVTLRSAHADLLAPGRDEICWRDGSVGLVANEVDDQRRIATPNAIHATMSFRPNVLRLSRLASSTFAATWIGDHAVYLPKSLRSSAFERVRARSICFFRSSSMGSYREA